GPIQVGNTYDSFDDAKAAVYQAQEVLGHKWIVGQSYTENGAVKKVTLRCNCYRTAKETHNLNLDPSDHRRGKSGRTGCKAHVNICRIPGKVYISLIDAAHNHDRIIPEGGRAQRPATAAQREVAAKFSDFSCGQLAQVLASEFPDHPLEPRQISNIRNDARREANAAVDALGGDVASILASLEELNRTEPGWDYSVQMDSNNEVVSLWWQSPDQAALTRRYSDILLNDNSYNRNDKQYPLSIGIIIDS
ncbi:hypothetical protein C8R46DRAFT_1279373, partial [Mycena filopes]